MSHSSKCSGGRDVLLDLFSSRVPVTCDAKTRSYQLDDIGFRGMGLTYRLLPGPAEFFTYLTQLLENPERAGPCVFDQQRYTTAAEECLRLCLCSYRHFSKGAMEYGHRDRALRRSKPSAWIARMGVYSRIRKGRHHLQVQLKASVYIHQDASFPDNSPEHEYFRSLSYKWALDLLPFFLENSAISLELAEVLRRRTFTTMAQKFPRRKRLAKEAITKYLLRVESAAEKWWISGANTEIKRGLHLFLPSHSICIGYCFNIRLFVVTLPFNPGLNEIPSLGSGWGNWVRNSDEWERYPMHRDPCKWEVS